jgi:hypothetical protein
LLTTNQQATDLGHVFGDGTIAAAVLDRHGRARSSSRTRPRSSATRPRGRHAAPLALPNAIIEPHSSELVGQRPRARLPAWPSAIIAPHVSKLVGHALTWAPRSSSGITIREDRAALVHSRRSYAHVGAARLWHCRSRTSSRARRCRSWATRH